MKFCPIDVVVVPSTSFTVVIPEIDLENGDVHTLVYQLTRPEEIKADSATGTEQVFIQNGAGGTSYPLGTLLGNIFYADRLILCKKDPKKYRIAFANNGFPAAVQHFECLNTPKIANPYNPGNVTVPTPPAP